MDKPSCVRPRLELTLAIKTLQEITRERIVAFLGSRTPAFPRCRWARIYGVTEISADPDHIGSALLLELADDRFLLSAAHVIDWNNSTNFYLGADSFALLRFEALASAAPGGDRNKDHADFAIARIGAELSSKLTGGRARHGDEIDIERQVGAAARRKLPTGQDLPWARWDFLPPQAHCGVCQLPTSRVASKRPASPYCRQPYFNPGSNAQTTSSAAHSVQIACRRRRCRKPAS